MLILNYHNHETTRVWSLCNTWLATRRPGIWNSHAIGAMHVFNTSGQYLSICSFCHVHIQKPFSYLLLSVTKAERELLRRNKPFLMSILIYLVSAAAGAQSPLLWALIRIRTSGLFRYNCSHWSTEQRHTCCASYPPRKNLQWQSVNLRTIFAFISGDSTFIEITN